MANVYLTEAANQAAMDAVTALIDVGGAGTIQIYDGTQPADANTAITTQTLLATLTFTDVPGAFAAATTAGVAAANSISPDTSADADGTASWARISDGAATPIFDCDVTVTAGVGTIKLNTVAITSGGAVSMTSFNLTHPDGI